MRFWGVTEVAGAFLRRGRSFMTWVGTARRRTLDWFLTCLSIALMVSCGLLVMVARGEVNTPSNGAFDGSLSYWGVTGGTIYWIEGGHDGNGCMRLTGNVIDVAISQPMVVGSGATMNFWAWQLDITKPLYVDIYVWSDGTKYANTYYPQGYWQLFNVPISGYVGKEISVGFRSYTGATQYVDEVTTSGVANKHYADARYLNGNMTTTSRWVCIGQGWLWSWTGTVGHDLVGSWIRSGSTSIGTGVMPIPFLVPEGGDFTFWYRAQYAGHVLNINVAPMTTSAVMWTIKSVTSVQANTWEAQTFDLGVYQGQVVLLMFEKQANNSTMYIDEVCPVGSGCLGGAAEEPTPVPTETPTELPTQTPGGPTATSTAPATQTPGGPTATSTPAQVNINCGWPENPCYVWVQNTPLAVTIEGFEFPDVMDVQLVGTVIVQVDQAGTPFVVVTNTPATTPTAVPAEGIDVGPPETAWENPVSGEGVIPIGGSDSDPEHVVDVGIETRSFSFCLPGAVTKIIGVDSCYSSNFMVVSGFTFGGVNVAAAMGAVVLMLVVVFVIRQLQER